MDRSSCSFDGKKNITKELLDPNKDETLTLPKKMGLTLLVSSPASLRLMQLYKKVLKRLGYQGSRKALEKYAAIKTWSYTPPNGFIAWHTNRYDNNIVPYRIYVISVDRDGESAFKYRLPDDQTYDVYDYHGAVRLFSNTFKDKATGLEKYLWHTIYTKNAHRQSVGFEIRPEELIALLDLCETCWDKMNQQYEAIHY